jgi:hypothetical protein
MKRAGGTETRVERKHLLSSARRSLHIKREIVEIPLRNARLTPFARELKPWKNLNAGFCVCLQIFSYITFSYTVLSAFRERRLNMFARARWMRRNFPLLYIIFFKVSQMFTHTHKISFLFALLLFLFPCGSKQRGGNFKPFCSVCFFIAAHEGNFLNLI